MDFRILLSDLSSATDLQKLVSAFSEITEQLDILYTESAPNGAISSRKGRVALYKNGSSYELWVNTDGATAWSRMDYGATVSPFVAGDWIISSVNTARTGWTDVSGSYSNKFMRINATPKSTGGADSVTLAEANIPQHAHAYGTLAADSGGAHQHKHYHSSGVGAGVSYVNHTDGHPTSGLTETTYVSTPSGGDHSHTVSGSTGNWGTGSPTAVATVPAYTTVCVFEKDA